MMLSSLICFFEINGLFVCLFVCLCPLGTRGILLALKEVALYGKTI